MPWRALVQSSAGRLLSFTDGPIHTDHVQLPVELRSNAIARANLWFATISSIARRTSFLPADPVTASYHLYLDGKW
jgi:hypothetical protein